MTELTRDLLNELFDYRDGSLYWKVSPCKKIKRGAKAGTLRKDEYAQVRVKGKLYLVHRLIFLMQHGSLPKYIDHIDGDPSNNSIENLRECTQSQNLQNAKMPRNNTSGTKGVCWRRDKQAWHVRISKKHVGLYKDRELADLVAIEYRDLHHREFARTI